MKWFTGYLHEQSRTRPPPSKNRLGMASEPSHHKIKSLIRSEFGRRGGRYCQSRRMIQDHDHYIFDLPSFPFFAVTSISIFISSSINFACTIVAAGLTSPKYFFSTGQTKGKSFPSGKMYRTLTTSCMLASASFSATSMFLSVCSAWSTIDGEMAPVE